ncbi:MAG: arginyltransferase [Gammaproteobacteria bacterium]
MISIPLFLTDEHPCSYLEGYRSVSAFVHPTFKLSTAVYSQLIAKGFRRSGDYVYVPNCPHCSKCIAVRLPVAQFRPKRHQKRCRVKNADTQAVIKPARFDQAHYDLYLRYQKSRHRDGNMAHSSPEEYMDFLGSTWCDTLFVEFLIKGKLIAVSVVDRLTNALSAVYTFFDPAYSAFSPGVYAVLWQIEWARKLELDWLYLGYWIGECHKMNYKTDYQPIQMLFDGKWCEMKQTDSH